MWKAVLRHVAFGTLSLVLFGCGGGGSSNGTRTGTIIVGDPIGPTATGRLVYRTSMKMPEAFFAGLTPTDIATLQQQGIQLGNGLLVFPDAPVSGEWVELGGTRYMTGRDGTVTVDAAAASTGSARIFRQLTDTTPTATLPVAGIFVPAGQTPPVTPAVRTLDTVGPMNSEVDPANRSAAAGDVSSRASSCCGQDGKTGAADSRSLGTRAGCNLRNVSACTADQAPCCTDYNGPLGDGQPYFRTRGPNEDIVPTFTVCGLLGIRNFLGSTCYNWSFGFAGAEQACDNERAFLWNGPNAPDCWNNHKYRNCQHLDANAFTVEAQDDTTVQPGDTVHIRIVNNTKANESGVVIEPDDSKVKGKLSGDGLDGDVLRHYDDGAHQHYAERTITYTAPQLPAGKTSITNTVKVMADGKEQDIEITVGTAPATWTGTFHYQTSGGHNRVSWQNTVPNGAVSVDMNVTLTGTAPPPQTGEVLTLAAGSKFSWNASGFQDEGGGHTLQMSGSGAQAFTRPDSYFSVTLDPQTKTARISFDASAGSAITTTETLNGETHSSAVPLNATSNDFGGTITAGLSPDGTIQGGQTSQTVTANNGGTYTATLSWSNLTPAQGRGTRKAGAAGPTASRRIERGSGLLARSPVPPRIACIWAVCLLTALGVLRRMSPQRSHAYRGVLAFAHSEPHGPPAHADPPKKEKAMSTSPIRRGTARLPRPCLVLALFALLAVGCGGGNKSGGSSDNGPLGGGPTRSGCAPKLSFVSPSGDGTLFIQGTMPATDSNGAPLHYQWRRAAAGIVGLSPWTDFTPTRNSPSDPTSGTANLTATVNGLQQPLPWKSGDTIQIRNECGNDSQSVI